MKVFRLVLFHLLSISKYFFLIWIDLALQAVVIINLLLPKNALKAEIKIFSEIQRQNSERLILYDIKLFTVQAFYGYLKLPKNWIGTKLFV